MENVLGLKYEDYMENAVFDIMNDSDTEEKISKLYEKIDEYNSLINNGKSLVINIGYSPIFGYYTYSKIDDKNYQLTKLGKDLEVAFLKIVIFNIEFENAVREERLRREKNICIFNNLFKDMGIEYSSCCYYADYINAKLNRFYHDNVPECVVIYLKDYLSKTTGIEWEYQVCGFKPIVKESGMKRKRELGNN